MPGTNRRHQEWFGPDLLRSPALSGSPEVAGVQVASAIAQLRAPLLRDDAQIEQHADFIRGLADRLFPDYAAQITMQVGDEVANTIETTIRVATGSPSLLHCWLADAIGGGLTSTPADTVAFSGGAVLQTVATGRHYVIVAPASGVVVASVTHASAQSWRWAVARHGRVLYSTALGFA